MLLHVWCSSLGVAFILLASLQAWLLARQEQWLRTPHLHHHPHTALETQEKRLTALLMIGFLTLGTGFLWGAMLSPQTSLLKVISAITAWCACGVLLCGRLHWGWRGTTLMGSTWLLTAVLIAGYFMSQWVD